MANQALEATLKAFASRHAGRCEVTFDFMKHFPKFATLAPVYPSRRAIGGSARSR